MKSSLFTFLFIISLSIFANSDCTKKIDALCANSIDINKCLKKNEAKINSVCKSGLGDVSNIGQVVSGECMAEFGKLCPINPNEFMKQGKAYLESFQKCINKNTSKLSSKCKGLFGKTGKSHKEI